MRLVALVLALVLVSAAAAGPSATGTLRGTVSRGPVTPVCSDAQPCYVREAGVRLVFLHRGHVVAHATTRADGSYRIRLAPGRYGVGLLGWRRWTPTRVLIRRGHVTRLDIAIDTGIR